MKMSFCSLRLILKDLFSLSKNVLNLLPQISFLYIELMTAIIETGSNPLNLVVIICTIFQNCCYAKNTNLIIQFVNSKNLAKCVIN